MSEQQFTRLARDILHSRRTTQSCARPSLAIDKFDLAASYRVAQNLTELLRESGWHPMGRKLGFTNRATWQEFDLSAPIWAPIYRETVIHADSEIPNLAVKDFVALRIEPEIVLGLNERIETLDHGPDALASAIDWVAPGFEVVDCHYPNWEFNAADIVADFGAHARLVIGHKVRIEDADRKHLASALAEATVELFCDDELIDCGIGANALDGPLAALENLILNLRDQNGAPPLQTGEIVTTGTLTSIPYVQAKQTWRAQFDGANLDKVVVGFS